MVDLLQHSICNYYGFSMYSDYRLVHLFCQVWPFNVTSNDFGSFTVHVDKGLQVGGGDNRGFSARRSGNPVFKCKALKEV